MKAPEGSAAAAAGPDLLDMSISRKAIRKWTGDDGMGNLCWYWKGI